MFEPGDAIAGKYKVTRLLGEGGMGHVYEAHQEALGIHVAIKILRDEAAADPEAVARFAREAKASAVLRGPHTARVFDVGALEDGRPFMVMEMLQGHDLGVELEARKQLSVTEAASYVVQACEAITEAHEIGIVHRDLKPANIFLARAGSRTVVKILDFGISRFDKAGEARVTQTQSAFGTPLYMSPEAIRSAKHTDLRADIWALGVILYELISGVTPFLGDTPTSVAVSITVDPFRPLSELVRGIPPELDAIVTRALQKDANRRYQTVGELSDALAPFAGPPPRMSLPGPVSARGTEIMSPLGSSNGYVVDTANQRPSSVARTTLDRMPAEKPSRGVMWMAIGVALSLGAIAGAAAFLFHRSESVATGDSPARSEPNLAAAEGSPEPRVEQQAPRVDATASAVMSAVPPAASEAESTPRAASARPLRPAQSSSPTGERPAAEPTLPASAKKAPALAPTAPGGNPLIL